jgi:2-succinyl-5-enolpyruvyl-6-hydroxy-3-cyclohexene-1-carboxylate synthase
MSAPDTPARAADVQAAFSAVLVDEWVRAGVCDAVVAPGSRSTPMLAALADDGRIRLHVVLDERSAGFVALGLGLATGRVAPVVTTSGTAAAELHPAVVEAHQAGVPLLAVTADRPPELHQVGAPQTIEQEGLFGDVPRWAVSPGVPDLASADSWRSLASRAVAATQAGAAGPGPVHLNLAFREPLLGDPGRVAHPAGRPDGEPWHRVTPAAHAPLDAALVERVAGFAGRRGLLVAGGGLDDPAALVELGRRVGWPVFADPRSGARVPGPPVIGAFDSLLRARPVRDWLPEIVVRVGQLPASKVLGQWLADLPGPIPQILLDPTGAWGDPDRRVSEVCVCDPSALASAVIATLDSQRDLQINAASPGWAGGWARAEAAAQAALDAALCGDPALGEPAIARATSRALREGSILVASSSMPVRDLEWFAAPRVGVQVVANRGANGIDGVVSTALGAALSGRPAVALIGDLAFAYDVAALLWAAERDIDCTYVIVDNDGGGIFSFLPQAEQLAPERFERLWGTPHRRDLLAIARAYGASTADVDSLDGLTAALGDVGTGKGVRVLRCRTDRAANVADHDRLNAAVAGAVADLSL